MRIRPRPEKASPPAEQPEEKRSLWSYPKSWLRQESFYRDITTRAVAAGIVAVVAYLYALAAGYVHTPSGKRSAVVAACVVVSIMYIWCLWLLSKKFGWGERDAYALGFFGAGGLLRDTENESR